MKRILAVLLILPLLLGGCSAMGPGHDGAIFWGYAEDDNVGDYLWKSLTNVVFGVAYVTVGAVYVLAQVGVVAARCR